MRSPIHSLFAAICCSLPMLALAARSTLTMAAFPDLDRSVKSAIEAWAHSHPDVEIKLTTRAYADHPTAMTTAIATGANLPDVMAIDMDYLGKLTQAGGLEDLQAAPYDADAVAPLLAHFTLPLAPRSLQGSGQTPWGALCAGAAIAVLPLLVLFAVASRRLIDGLTAGAVKH
jgi:multiple sugar transport system substrate-binding protein